MVLLTATTAILQALNTLSPEDRSSLRDVPGETGEPVAHSTLIQLSRLARRYGSNMTLERLLRGCSVYQPPPPTKPEPSAEYVELMERLRKEQELREYRALLSKERLATDQGGVDDSEEKDDLTPSLVFNILLSVIMCGVAMFHMTRWWTSDAVRVLVSMLVALVVGVAEVVVYAGYMRTIKRNKEKQRNLKEKKYVIGEVTGDDGEQTVNVVAEKEEIWGRGKQGGMRRRVREKWEKEQVQLEGE
jgi:TMEM199 family protein